MSAARTESTRRAAMLALLTLAGCAAVGGAAWQAQARAAESIRRGVFERLTSIREAKRREITAYLEDTCSRTEMLARMPGIVEAMRELAASFGTIEATEQDRPAVLKFYQEEIGPRLNGGKSDVDPATLAPSDPAALAAQAAFIARNPHPVGEKMNLSDLGDASAYARQHARFAYSPAKMTSFYKTTRMRTTSQLAYKTDSSADSYKLPLASLG